MDESARMPILYTSGCYYEVGFQIGSFYVDKIQSFFQKSKKVQELFIPYVATEKGKQFKESTLKVCQENFPQYISELQGIADGSGLSFEEVFLLNISNEIEFALTCEDGAAGCTDVMMNTPDTKLMAHNEDCDPIIGLYGYMVSARIVKDGQEVENFTAFCYPGILAGHTFAFNTHGMVFSINGLYVNYIVHNTPSRMFISRAVIRAQNVDEAIVILKNKGYGAAYGFCTNISDVKCPSKLWSIELGPHASESLLHVNIVEEETDPQNPCHYTHYNVCKHLRLTSNVHHSSVARDKRVKEMTPPRTRQDMLNILGDTTDQLHPIFRKDRPTGEPETTFTSVVDILQRRVDFYRGNPAKDGAVPLFHLKINS